MSETENQSRPGTATTGENDQSTTDTRPSGQKTTAAETEETIRDEWVECEYTIAARTIGQRFMAKAWS